MDIISVTSGKLGLIRLRGQIRPDGHPMFFQAKTVLVMYVVHQTALERVLFLCTLQGAPNY